VDLGRTDEQSWISASIDSLLARQWVAPQDAVSAPAGRREGVWAGLVSFGALSVGGADGLGAAELCLIARALGAHLASVPFLGSAGVRLALAPFAASLPPAMASLLSGRDAISIALLEPGTGWATERPRTTLAAGSDAMVLHGEKAAVEQLESARHIAVSADLDGSAALVVIPVSAAGLTRRAQPCFDATLRMGQAGFEAVQVPGPAMITGEAAQDALGRLRTAGALLAAADAIGAAARIFRLACDYAATRRQFGHVIASFQAVRHLLADAYVRQESAWSAISYAAAALDADSPETAQATSVAKAYAARSGQEIAHGAMQVFGGIAFTAEHPAHRFLRRVSVRAQQFGDAAHHEELLGRTLAGRAAVAQARLAEGALA